MFLKEEEQEYNMYDSQQDVEDKFHSKFRNIHLTMELFMIFIVAMSGIILFFFAYGDKNMIQVGTKAYIKDYVIIPILVNLFIYVITYVLIKEKYVSGKISYNSKNIIMNVSFVLLMFSSATFYQFFPVAYVGFSLPVILSAVYGSYRIIGVTSVLSAGLSVLSAFFIQYDKDRVMDSFYLVNLIIVEVLLLVCITYAFLSSTYVKARFLVLQKSMNMIDKLRLKLNTDSVTGLYSILEFNGYIRKVREKEPSVTFSVVYLAIDEFIHINNNFGYAYGDKVLNILAEVVRREEEIIPMRYGGAEFVLIVKKTEYETRKILERFRNEFIKSCEEVLNNPYISFSAGITLGDVYVQPEVMMARANSAMNYARTSEEISICVFNSGNMVLDEKRFMG